MLFRRLIAALFGLAFAAAAPAAADDLAGTSLASRDHPMPIGTDINIITAIDVSDSITQQEEKLQYDGLSRGVVDPRFLARVAEGLEQRVGFLVFTWSSGGDIRIVVPWTVIEDRADGARVAALLDAAPRIDRRGFGMFRPSSLDQGARGMTDIAEAVRSALQISMTAPFSAGRSVINVLSNGVDNNGQNPQVVRDEAIRQGMTINGVVFGNMPDLPDYFRRNIVGGPGAFLMTVQKPADLPIALEKKFWQDLIAGLPESAAG
ncbi:DUF1194 domain-containing protein [Pelagibius marinus]|uniref:DUF1194 domain-containing protein n=1 Tax=Pelagibius marinus TaxID=2762760 RepID=UPI0018732903|nr:DUF1194 domain-containing protein [Pelagibius marinus]